jgi:DNA-binding NtrC family response regulator
MRLKRVIQTKEYCRENSTQHLTADVRLIVSSTEDLTSPEYRGAFSRDLLYHLMANTLRIPPLRERPGDIRLLAEAALGMAARPGPAIRAISEEALDVLARYPFPCNDAELASIIEGAAMREETDVLMPGSLPEHVLEGRPPATEGGGGDFEPRRLADVERDHVARMVLYCKGDREKAAAELGIPVERVAEILGAADAASEGDG